MYCEKFCLRSEELIHKDERLKVLSKKIIEVEGKTSRSSEGM